MSAQTPQPPYNQVPGVPPYGSPPSYNQSPVVPPYISPPPAYGAPPIAGYTQVPVTGYSLQATTKTSGLAIASMVLGIISLVLVWAVWPGICAVLAVIFGHVALSAISKSNGWIRGKGMAIAG
ncbi:MAG: DUF4190 domain-containing protein, partial [Thermomicrobia bacterium]|nr:DUF4190 domain-containing protein [Thermomicrobia bacterium]